MRQTQKPPQPHCLCLPAPSHLYCSSLTALLCLSLSTSLYLSFPLSTVCSIFLASSPFLCVFLSVIYPIPPFSLSLPFFFFFTYFSSFSMFLLTSIPPSLYLLISILYPFLFFHSLFLFLLLSSSLSFPAFFMQV